MSTAEPWTIQRVIDWTRGRFSERGFASPRLDAELLLAHVLGCDRVRLYTHFDQPLQGGELETYRALIKRRLAGEPVAYLVGQKEFRSLELAVDARVLVPRPDTEILVEVGLAHLAECAEPPRVLDVGTGSGAVALALKRARPELQVLAVDRSPEALEVARANAARLELELELRVGDLLEPAGDRAPFALVVSNPPYIPTADLAALPPEVRHEPRLALDGGRDGLELIRRLISGAPPLLAPRGALALELGAGQAPRVSELFALDGRYGPAERARDLQGIERVVSARLRP